MTMPSQVLKPEARAFGMGVFFAVYYAVMMGGPTIGGGIAEMTGQAATAFFLGSAMLIVCVLALWAFRRGGTVT
jgi:predicted MFS family arabinose efflux permease